MPFYTVYPDRVVNDAFQTIPRDPGNADYQALLQELLARELDLDHPDGDFLREPWPVTLADHQQQLLADLADYRYQREVAGITVGSAAILTDRESQAKIHAALFALQQNMITAITWKAANGWVTLDEPTLRVIAATVVAHVQACFIRESELSAMIMALETVEAAQQFILAEAW